MSLTLLHSPQDAGWAETLRRDLAAAGYTFSDDLNRIENPVLVLLSNSSLNDASLVDRLYQALDLGRHIIPVLVDDVSLPKIIDHLTPINLKQPQALDTVRAYIDAASGPDAGIQLKVLTPRARRSNQRAGLVVAAIAVLMFVVGIIGVAVLNIEVPVEEFNLVDTQVAQTRDLLLAPTLEAYLLYLPGSQEQAAEYPATLRAVPTRIRPFVAATATAVANDQQN